MSKLLIHIGYFKAGSTTLQDWFGRHPQLRYAPGGLGGFKSVYEIARVAATTGDGCYEYLVTSFEDLVAPRTSAGIVPYKSGRRDVPFDWPTRQPQVRARDILKSLFPTARILIVTRGFKGFVQSAYSQYIRGGGVLSVSEFFLSDDATLDQVLDFDAVIRLYAEAYGRESLLILPYELLRDDPRAFIATLEERLGLRHCDIEIGRLNPSLSPEELYWYPIISNWVSAMAWPLGETRFARIYRWYVRKTLRNRLWWLVRILNRVHAGAITSADFPWDEILPRLKGKAELLRRDPLYAPYAREYLWEE